MQVFAHIRTWTQTATDARTLTCVHAYMFRLTQDANRVST